MSGAGWNIASRGLIVAVGALLVATPVFAAELTGIVQLDGPAPEPAILARDAEGMKSLAGCPAEPIVSQKLLVNSSGGVQNTVVWIDQPAADGTAASEPVLLDQQGCVFVPHIVVVPLGGTLAIRNSDAARHNVRLFRDVRMLWHEWQPAGGKDLPQRFDEPGRYLIRCGIHPWMHAWAVVAPHAGYAVTDAAGGFRIENVPDGERTVHAWHEALGQHNQPIRIAGSAAVTIRFTPQRGMAWD